MSKPKRGLTPDEKRLWREVAKTVKPRRLAPIEEDNPAPAPAPPSTRGAHTGSTALTTRVAKAVPAAPPANRHGEKKVRRGQLEIDAKLDLHGHTQDRAQAALGRFLHAAHARSDRTVIVITGVGRSGEGIIKRRFTDWISEPSLRRLISGYAPAHRSHGGAGAFYVFLKRTTKDPR